MKYKYSGCSSLSQLVIGSGVKNIGPYAFANCQELTKVYCYAEQVPSTIVNAFDGSYIEYAKLYVPSEAVNAYKEAEPWKYFGKINTIGNEPMVYKLVYIIDGTIYKTYEIEEGESIQVEYGSTITPPATDGDGNEIQWNAHPTTMPAYDITIYGTCTTGIDAVKVSDADAKMFSLDGKAQDKPQRGVNIVRTCDGKTKKVVVK